MTASGRAAGELVADVDTLTGFIRNHPALPPRELAEALVAAGFGRIDAARREALLDAAGEAHREARWQTEQEIRYRGLSQEHLHSYASGRVSLLEQILRDRAHQIGAAS